MGPTAQDIYFLLSNSKLKKIAEIFQDGFTGMFVVLKILDNAKKELSAGDISEMFGVTTARTAVVLNVLEKKGYINKTKSSLDARKTIVKLTDKGLTSLNERKQKIINAIEHLMSCLDNNDIKNFYNILQKLIIC